jgi:hypothetical protein
LLPPQKLTELGEGPGEGLAVERGGEPLGERHRGRRRVLGRRRILDAGLPDGELAGLKVGPVCLQLLDPVRLQLVPRPRDARQPAAGSALARHHAGRA